VTSVAQSALRIWRRKCAETEVQGSLERGRCKDLQTENDLNDIKSLLTCRETRLRRRYMFLATTKLGLDGRRKIRSSRYQYLPSHMSKIVDTPPQSRYCRDGWSERHLFQWREGVRRDSGHKVNFLHRFFQQPDASRRCFTVVLARYVLNARHSIECKEVKGVIFNWQCL
jgi:hypothetical protein